MQPTHQGKQPASWTHQEPDRARNWAAAGGGKESFLVIEDEADIRESMRMVLCLEGHDTQTASNGMEGLHKLQACTAPDVVLIDIRMPGMNGYEVAQQARNLPQGELLKLVAVTAYGSSRERARAFAAGFDAHVTKPCSYTELMDAIHGIAPH